MVTCAQSVSSAAEAVAKRRLPPPEVRGALRRANNLTQGDMARIVGGVHPVTVARWEGGTREPRGETRERYAAVLAALAGWGSDDPR